MIKPTNEIAVVENKELLFEPKNLTKETVRKYLCPTASDEELMMGLQIAKTFNLNPLKREVYFVKYGADKMKVLRGYEVYLKRAERSGKYDGLEITSEGNIADGSLKAVVKVYRKDWKNPLIHEAFYVEYVQTKKVYGPNREIVGEEPNRFWKTKPVTMIKKVAVSQAFRMAFPDEFDGMPYTSDEVVDQEKVIDLDPKEPEELKQPKKKEKADPVISGVQVSMLIEACNEAKLKQNTFIGWLKFNYKVESPMQIRLEDYEGIMTFIKENKI